MANPPIIHHLGERGTPCAMRGVPRDWPPGHSWSASWAEVTCTECKAAGAGLTVGGDRAELALEIVGAVAGAACRVCYRPIILPNDAIWAGRASLAAPAVCICAGCMIAGLRLLHDSRHGV